MSKKVLVLGEDTRSFLSVIRSLGKAGYDVDVVCYDRQSPSLKSTYIKQTYFLNYQSYTQEEWLNALIELVAREQYDALFPCDERAIFPLFENKEKFPSSCLLAIPNKEVIDHLFDKNTTKQLAIKCDVPVARGEIITLKDKSLDYLQAQFGQKFVIKPTLSFKSEELSKRQKVEIVETEEQLAAYTKYIDDSDQFLIEEYFTGIGEGVSLLAADGQVQHLFAHSRVNEPRAGGGSSYRKAIPVDAGMAEACIKLCEATKFNGVGMFEFKKDQMTGNWILIEVNARFWGSLPLAIHAGIDFPADYARLLFGELTPHRLPNQQYNLKAYARSLSNDLYDTKAEFEYDIKQGHALQGFYRLVKRGLGYTRLLTNETFDSYDAQDKAPFKEEIKQFYGNTLGGKIKKILPNNSITSTEMNRLISLLYTAPCISIKFVCYGNIMRSPMAHKTLQTLCDQVNLDWHIDSFGFHQNENRRSPIECINGAKNIGIDLDSHRSQWLKQSEINPDTDIIFIFDERNSALLDSFYDCKYVFNLAHFVPTGLGLHQEIADPYGNGDEAVKYCYLLVVEAVKNVFEQYLKVNSK